MGSVIGGRAGARRVVLAATGALAVVLLGALLAAGAGAEPKTVVVPTSTDSWKPSGFTAKAGEEVEVTATGRGMYCGASPDCTAPNPDGDPDQTTLCDGGYDGVSGAHCIALLGRWGENGHGFVIGKDRTLTAPRDAQLYLGIHDWKFDDNSGSYRVTIERPSGLIVGTVVDKKGNPVPGARITAERGHGSGGRILRRAPGGGPSASTGLDGTYKLEIVNKEESFLPAQYRVQANGKVADRFKPDKRTVTVRPGTPAKASFKAKVDCKKGEDPDPDFFNPKHGTFVGSGQRTYAVGLYYSCESRDVIAWLRADELVCANGSEVANPTAPYAASPPIHVAAHGSFSYRGVSAYGDPLHPTVVNMRVEGDFLTRTTARATVVISKLEVAGHPARNCRAAASNAGLSWASLDPEPPEI